MCERNRQDSLKTAPRLKNELTVVITTSLGKYSCFSNNKKTARKIEK